jgi:hypothetical protein
VLVGRERPITALIPQSPHAAGLSREQALAEIRGNSGRLPVATSDPHMGMYEQLAREGAVVRWHTTATHVIYALSALPEGAASGEPPVSPLAARGLGGGDRQPPGGREAPGSRRRLNSRYKTLAEPPAPLIREQEPIVTPPPAPPSEPSRAAPPPAPPHEPIREAPPPAAPAAQVQLVVTVSAETAAWLEDVGRRKQPPADAAAVVARVLEELRGRAQRR